MDFFESLTDFLESPLGVRYKEICYFDKTYINGQCDDNFREAKVKETPTYLLLLMRRIRSSQLQHFRFFSFNVADD